LTTAKEESKTFISQAACCQCAALVACSDCR
jgi:hypothetical protein